MKDTFVYIPILETLTFMCRNSKICKLLENAPRDKSVEDTYEDLCDGSYFKTHPLFSKHCTIGSVKYFYGDLNCQPAWIQAWCSQDGHHLFCPQESAAQV